MAADELRGARVLADQLWKEAAEKTAAAPSATPVPHGPEEAAPAPARTAREWLDAVGKTGYQPERWLTLAPPPDQWEAFRDLVNALPPPRNTPEARNRFALKVVSNALLGDYEALAALAAVPEKGELSGTSTLRRATELYLLNRQTDPKAAEAVIRKKLEAIRKQQNRFEVPDLVSLFGEAKATGLLGEILLAGGADGARLDFSSAGPATSRLARKIAMERLKEFSGPALSSLLESLEAGALYEAVAKKLGAGAAEDGFAYYIFGLVISGQSEKALEKAFAPGAPQLRIPYGLMRQLEEAGRSPEIFAFLSGVLKRQPDLRLWDDAIRMAARSGLSAQVPELLRKAIARPETTTALRFRLELLLAKALLADDQVEEGVALLEKQLDALAGQETTPAELVSDHQEMALLLVRLGKVLGRPALGDRGVQELQVAAQAALYGKDDPRYTPNEQVMDALIENDRAREAERIYFDSLEETQKRYREALAASPAANWKKSPSRLREAMEETLVAMLGLYYRTDRPGDVITLLEQAPYWKSGDLAAFATQSVPEAGNAGFVAAWALARTGRQAEALPILHVALERLTGFDPAYRLLIELEGEKAIARLDAMAAGDRFQERPLIWKAHLLFKAGKPEEAEAVVREAIAIDPSDGEQGKGDRMRAYAVLADIREGRGDAKEAAFFREVVRAIRLSEEADSVAAAGLLSRSVAMYREALTHFSDAYCIQSRLAIKLMAQGKAQEALVHYRKAYELMPDSFGRVESHCFGCERAFAGEVQQTLAERVFTEMSEKTPDKAQVFYLLGYLRSEQDRYPEAMEVFRKAVALDPDYYNAWKKMHSAAPSVILSPEERDAITLNLVRLDPANRRYRSPRLLQPFYSYRKLWETLDVPLAKGQPVPQGLYKLKGFVPMPGNPPVVWNTSTDGPRSAAELMIEDKFLLQAAQILR